MATRYALRLASRLKFLVSHVLLSELRDPRLGFLTILEVEVSRDLRHATVRYSVLGSAAQKSKTMHALDDARGFVQRQVGKNLGARYTPVLRFVLDEGQERSARMDSLIEEVQKQPEAGSSDFAGR